MSNHTTLSIDKKIYNRAASRAKKQQFSVSAITRILLDAYASGQVQIGAILTNQPVKLRELSKKEIGSELRKKADKAYKMDKSEFINL